VLRAQDPLRVGGDPLEDGDRVGAPPGLRLGWFVMPEHLAEPMAAAKIAADRGSPAHEQFALADLITCGEFDRHLRRMRPIYRRRCDALLTASAQRMPRLQPVGISAGLHLVTWLPPHLDEASWSRWPRAPGWASRA